MHGPVRKYNAAAPVPFDTIRGPIRDGTEVTFLTPNRTASTGITVQSALYHKENKALALDLTFAPLFAWFSLYRLLKTCTSGQEYRRH